ncbi:trans-sialidase, putative, partial [Trypanosoma cruzi]
MGVKMSGDGNPVLLGLSYDSGKKWHVLCRDGKSKELSSTWETERTHQVAIVLRNGNQSSAYVDGQRVGGNEECALENKGSKDISHFYIGGDEDEKGDADNKDVSVTVTNVLLYNRPLSSAEMTALNTKLSISKAKEAKTVKVTPQEVSEPATLETETPSGLGGQQQNEQVPLRTSENAGSDVLSTSAASTATTSPAVKESDNQSASGTSPEEHSNVDVDSSSEGVQTVDAETGD